MLSSNGMCAARIAIVSVVVLMCALGDAAAQDRLKTPVSDTVATVHHASSDTAAAQPSTAAPADFDRVSGCAELHEAAPDGADARQVRPECSNAQGGVRDTVNAIASAEPYHFVSRGTVARVPNPGYDAGSMKRWLLGRQYREMWTMPLQVPLIDLEQTAGGLTPIEPGGGMQTTSLHMEGGDGHFYVLRSVDKTAARSTPEGFRNTFVQSVAQDQISSLNPLGAFILPHLARAAGILHNHPTLVVIPDSPRLGEFRQEYAGMLALFERKADEDQSGAARFGHSKNIVGSAKMFEKAVEDNDARVDERAYARARLFDMLIGDWDRHDEQWRWAEFNTEHGTRFVPVPKDRDFAFVKFDGYLNMLGRRYGPMTMRRLGDFNEDIGNVLTLNWQGSKLDRRITPSLTRSDWIEIADSLRLALTDDVIDEAVRTWPDAVHDRIGAMTAGALKERRDQLPTVASEYYDLLAEVVDIIGTDKHERFEITRLSADVTRIVLLKTKKEGDVVRELLRRDFKRDETDEIRLYGLGGNDQFVVEGAADNGILVRIIGGEDEDRFVNRSEAPAHLTRFHDTKANTVVESSSAARIRLSDDPSANMYEPLRFELNPISPVASIDYNSDDGLFVGGGVRLERAGFRKDPYAARHLMSLNVAPKSRAFNARYDGRLVSVWNRFDLQLEAEALAADEFRNFYGFGNETSELDRFRYIADMQAVSVSTALHRSIRRGYVTFGPRAEYVKVDRSDDGRSAGFTSEQLIDKYLAGFESTIALDGRDSTLNTQAGFFWTAQSDFHVGVRTSDVRFGRLASELRLYYTLPLPFQVTFALRGGGATNFGSFPFFAASTLGGSENLRGLPRTRFAGRSAVFANADLRAKMFDFNLYVLKGELGLLGFVDHGRIWADEAPSSLWHTGYGGGLWLAPFDVTILTATLGYSDEGALLDLSVGFQF